MTRKFFAFTAAAAFATAAFGQDAAQTRSEIEAAMGGVPTFVTQVADAALPGLWKLTADLEFSEDTALDPKTKSLISLAVASQIPCTYCIWADTNTARSHGATDQEIAEAVALAGLTRAWSTIFNGMQVDFAQFQAELAGN